MNGIHSLPLVMNWGTWLPLQANGVACVTHPMPCTKSGVWQIKFSLVYDIKESRRALKRALCFTKRRYTLMKLLSFQNCTNYVKSFCLFVQWLSTAIWPQWDVVWCSSKPFSEIKLHMKPSNHVARRSPLGQRALHQWPGFLSHTGRSAQSGDKQNTHCVCNHESH